MGLGLTVFLQFLEIDKKCEKVDSRLYLRWLAQSAAPLEISKKLLNLPPEPICGWFRHSKVVARYFGVLAKDLQDRLRGRTDYLSLHFCADAAIRKKQIKSWKYYRSMFVLSEMPKFVSVNWFLEFCWIFHCQYDGSLYSELSEHIMPGLSHTINTAKNRQKMVDKKFWAFLREERWIFKIHMFLSIFFMSSDL